MDHTDFEQQNFSAILTEEVATIQMESPGSAFREAAFTELIMDWFSESGETGTAKCVPLSIETAPRFAKDK